MRLHPALALALALAAVLMLLGGCGTAPYYSRATFEQPASRLTADESNDIAIHAMGLVGTPYRYGGNTPDTGFDCSGLIGYVYQKRAGTAPPRTVAQLEAWGQPIAAQSLRAGDLVVFGRGRLPSHAGVYVGQGRFVHAPSSGGVVRLDRLDSRYWAGQRPAFRRP